MGIGELLRNYRIKKGLTQKVVSDRAGTSVFHIGRIENNLTRPRRSTLNALASALELEGEELTNLYNEYSKSLPRKRESAGIPSALRRRARQDCPLSSSQLVIGTTETMQVSYRGADRVQVDFHGTDHEHNLTITKLPIQLLAALEKVLEVEEMIADFRGENFQGRACSFRGAEYCLVARFSPPQPSGYLIHMESGEIRLFREMLLQLPASAYPTD